MEVCDGFGDGFGDQPATWPCNHGDSTTCGACETRPRARTIGHGPSSLARGRRSAQKVRCETRDRQADTHTCPPVCPTIGVAETQRRLCCNGVLTPARPTQSTTRVKPFICTMPMRLDEGWNQIQFNLSDFTRRAYGTNYIETLRVQIHANCRIRRIYFSDRLYSEEELPPEFKLFLPIQKTA